MSECPSLSQFLFVFSLLYIMCHFQDHAQQIDASAQKFDFHTTTTSSSERCEYSAFALLLCLDQLPTHLILSETIHYRWQSPPHLVTGNLSVTTSILTRLQSMPPGTILTSPAALLTLPPNSAPPPSVSWALSRHGSVRQGRHHISFHRVVWPSRISVIFY